MLELNAKTTALVVIDLQEGILPFAGGPHTADEVVNRAGKLAAKFRASGFWCALAGLPIMPKH